jgi:SAM-dependent methyltransferase
MRRVVTPELLDEDLGTPEEVSESLADLRWVNQWFGGVRTTVGMVMRVARETGARRFSLLDVGAGLGDATFAARRVLEGCGIAIEPTLLDRKASHMPNGTSGRNGTRCVVGDAVALPFRDSSFDLVSCALFAHHLDSAQLVTFVQESLRVCRMAVLINDLRRSTVSLALVYAGLPLMRSRLSRHDGVASVRRAYTIGEMRSLLASAKDIDIRRHYLYRMGVVVWKGK